MKMMLLLLALICLPLVASAQLDRCHQPDAPLIGCGWPKDTTPEQKRETATVAYIGVSALVLMSNETWHWEHDPGGYNKWKIYPEKQALHFMVAGSLTMLASEIGVRPWTAAAITCVSGAAFEVTQRYFNPWDATANCVGAAAGALFFKWIRNG